MPSLSPVAVWLELEVLGEGASAGVGSHEGFADEDECDDDVDGCDGNHLRRCFLCGGLRHCPVHS